MKFGIFYELQLPRQWSENSEYELFTNALEHIELADRLGYDYAWEVEHHFLEEHSHRDAWISRTRTAPSGMETSSPDGQH